jgi:hypothetical protein
MGTTMRAAATALLLVVAAVGSGAAPATGQETEPIEIDDWRDLSLMRANPDADYVLTGDLTAASPGYATVAGPDANGGEGFRPIGTDDAPFTGTFDGNGHVIADVSIERAEGQGVGLFGTVGRDGVVRNVALVNANVDGSDAVTRGVEGLVGVNRGTVRDASVLGTVEGVLASGLLAGVNRGTVQDVSTAGTVRGVNTTRDGRTVISKAPGGVVGFNRGTLTNATAAATVTSAFRGAGGLVGENGGTVADAVATGPVTGVALVGGLVGANRGSITGSAATGRVTGVREVGGLVGGNGGDVTLENGEIVSAGGGGGARVTESLATGNVTGQSYVGGLVGVNVGSTVGRAYALGAVTGRNGTGGLVGTNAGAFGTASVTDSYAAGSVTGTPETTGGAVGLNLRSGRDEARVTAVAWDRTATGQRESAGADDGGVGTAELRGRTAGTATDLTFDGPWVPVVAGQPPAPVPSGDGYPVLRGVDRRTQLAAQGLADAGRPDGPPRLVTGVPYDRLTTTLAVGDTRRRVTVVDRDADGTGELTLLDRDGDGRLEYRRATFESLYPELRWSAWRFLVAG